MRKFLIFLFVLGSPVFAGNEPSTERNAVKDTEIKQTVKELWEEKRTGASTAVLGASIAVLGTTVSSKGGPEIAGLGFSMTVAGAAISALGCYINFAKKRQLKRFLEDHKIELEFKGGFAYIKYLK